ncbi:lysozyme inhibitor LprI family protein [Oceanobacillus manasiensis]|uniref:lysozyme inhibitor LprI family protein n=1 Tax=Oceanobacillus manasiensis TaxID=586413 RepID=UPI000693F905|nr:lysozyme inhibitor LprI family protein [Oceanobacillus manasiensis]
MKKLLLAGVLILLLAACGNNDDESAKDTDNVNDKDTTAEETDKNAESESSMDEESETTATEEQDEESEVAEEEKPNSPDMKTTYRNKLVDLEEELAAEEQEIGSTQRELTEFAGKSFNMWDDALNEVYAELEKQLPEKEMESLRKEQREWVKIRDAKAEEEAAKYEGGSMETMQYISTQAQLTKERSYELITKYMD